MVILRSKKRYKTRDVCNLFDISKATLFRWEKEGLLSNVSRDWRNWRLYTDNNVKEIRAIMKVIKKKNERK